jgi:hypothetical protein
VLTEHSNCKIFKHNVYQAEMSGLFLIQIVKFAIQGPKCVFSPIWAKFNGRLGRQQAL